MFKIHLLKNICITLYYNVLCFFVSKDGCLLLLAVSLDISHRICILLFKTLYHVCFISRTFSEFIYMINVALCWVGETESWSIFIYSLQQISMAYLFFLIFLFSMTFFIKEIRKFYKI